jgi:hypothetical protein
MFELNITLQTLAWNVPPSQLSTEIEHGLARNYEIGHNYVIAMYM